jgi:PAS domain S-box-containing protein
MTIIVTSYLIFFGQGFSAPQLLPTALILFFLASNFVAMFLPPAYFIRIPFFYIVLLFDTIMVSLGIYLTGQFSTDFYLVYFLIIIFAPVSRSFVLLMISAVVICGIYGYFLWAEGIISEHLEKGILLRLPFLFIMNLFYGFLIRSFEERTEKIKRDLKEVEESEQRYRQIVEGAHDAVAILNEKNQIKFYNRRMAQLTQYDPWELRGMELNRILKGMEIDKSIQSLLENVGSEGAPKILEGDIFRKKGERRKVEVSASQFSLPNDTPYTILYLKDVTESKEMNERLLQSQKLRALGEMAAGMAHDINNVFGAILGRVQLIKLGLVGKEGAPKKMPDEFFKKELDIIEQAAMDGARTIKKVQEFTRKKIDQFQFVLHDLNETIDEAIEFLKAKIKDEAEARGVQIEVHKVKKDVPPVMGNPSELREALVNILLNGINAMPEGGKLTLETGMEKDWVTLKVTDDGIGMSDSVRERIFDPFFTTKGPQRSGLGLSVAYGLIYRHHGEIEVGSHEGGGTTFKVKIPMAKKGK